MLNEFLVDIYYQIKPLIPRRIQLFLRRKLIFTGMDQVTDIWPIDNDAARLPDNWKGWPEKKQFALLLTHDVDTKKGYDTCERLMEVDRDMGFRSSFGFVPERDYRVSPEVRHLLERNGFEVLVHDLKHNGKLFKSERAFRKGAEKINNYLKEWGSKGFRAGAMHCNLDWLHLLNIVYDASTFDTDPFEPKPKHMRTIFPFWVEPNSWGDGYVELPYTLPQDFTVFVLMREKTIDIWKRKLDWIAEKGGMVLFNTHPDYMSFDRHVGPEEYPVHYYKEFLAYITSRYEGRYWHVLPHEMAQFWNNRSA